MPSLLTESVPNFSEVCRSQGIKTILADSTGVPGIPRLNLGPENNSRAIIIFSSYNVRTNAAGLAAKTAGEKYLARVHVNEKRPPSP
jgi:hypothetical protein